MPTAHCPLPSEICPQCPRPVLLHRLRHPPFLRRMTTHHPHTTFNLFCTTVADPLKGDRSRADVAQPDTNKPAALQGMAIRVRVPDTYHTLTLRSSMEASWKQHSVRAFSKFPKRHRSLPESLNLRQRKLPLPPFGLLPQTATILLPADSQ